MGEVAYAATKLKRADANQLVKALLSRYEERIKQQNPPLGKKFYECHNPSTLTPSSEYMEIYLQVKKELEDLGLQFVY